jgi:hypothetical protein
VRALDLRRERLLSDPIVDPDEPEEEMGGYPLARAYSPDGRWAYTLYDGKEHPFVHALDTEGRTAKCIDLQHGIGKLGRLELETSPGGERLAVVDYVGKGGGEPTPVSFIDTATFEVNEPAEPATGPLGSAGGGGISPLVPIGLGVAGLAGAFLIARGTRRRAGLQT